MRCNSGDFGAVPRLGQRFPKAPTSGIAKPIFNSGRYAPKPKVEKEFAAVFQGGDFGGVSFNNGDFVTPGTSGMGDIFSDAMKTIFGTGATQVTQTLQSGAAAAATNLVATNLSANPNAQATINKTGIDAAKAVFNEYWYISYPLSAALIGIFGYGIYNMIKNKKA